MILISHRGNIDGKNETLENKPSYIDDAISNGYDVEVDVWWFDDQLWLGHDKPQYSVDFRWFRDRLSKLWVHCKNVDSIVYFKECGYPINYFWHENDKVVLTSKKNLWAFPTKTFHSGTIAVLPELFSSNVDNCEGICSDFIINYKK